MPMLSDSGSPHQLELDGGFETSQERAKGQ